MSTGLELAKIHVELTKGLCCEERRQEVGEEGYDRVSAGHCSPRNNSPPDGSLPQTHTHTHTHTREWVHVTMRGGSLSPPFSLTRGLQHFLPVHHESLKPSPTVSHGDLLQEVGHSFVTLPLLLHPSASRVIHSPVAILRIKVEAHLSIQAKLPGSTDVSVILTATCHPGLQGEGVCSHHGKERAQPLGLTNSLPHLGPLPVAQLMWPCALPKGHSFHWCWEPACGIPHMAKVMRKGA